MTGSIGTVVALVTFLQLVSNPAEAVSWIGPIKRILQTSSFLSTQPQTNIAGQNAQSVQTGTLVPPWCGPGMNLGTSQRY